MILGKNLYFIWFVTSQQSVADNNVCSVPILNCRIRHGAFLLSVVVFNYYGQFCKLICTSAIWIYSHRRYGILSFYGIYFLRF